MFPTIIAGLVMMQYSVDIRNTNCAKVTYIFSHSLKALWKVVSHIGCQLHGKTCRRQNSCMGLLAHFLSIIYVPKTVVGLNAWFKFSGNAWSSRMKRYSFIHPPVSRRRKDRSRRVVDGPIEL